MSSYLITGSNRGIGLAMVENLSARPASEVSAVFATSRSSDPGAALSAVIKSSGGRVHHVVLEVTSDESGKQAASEVAKIQGNKGLDVLIHNAGVQEPHGLVAGGKPENLPAQELQRVFDVNVMAPHKLTQAFLPLLRQGKDKKIAFISSTVGSMAYSQQKRYDAIPCPSYKVRFAARESGRGSDLERADHKGIGECTYAPVELRLARRGLHRQVAESGLAQDGLGRQGPRSSRGRRRGCSISGHNHQRGPVSLCCISGLLNGQC